MGLIVAQLLVYFVLGKANFVSPRVLELCQVFFYGPVLSCP
jgi:hypothetical protein